MLRGGGVTADRTVSRVVAPLLFAAMAIFVVTVVMGILNGTDLVDLPHGALLAHVHSGTLGWISLSVFAGAAWIFDARMPRLLGTARSWPSSCTSPRSGSTSPMSDP